jgi:hypothetical protein
VVELAEDDGDRVQRQRRPVPHLHLLAAAVAAAAAAPGGGGGGGGGIGGRAWASGGLGFTRSRRSAGWSRRAKAAGGGSRGNATGPPRARPPPHPGRWGRACGRRPRAEAAATRLPERDPSRARPPPDAAGSAAEACCDGERRRRTASLPLPVGVWGREM